MSSRTKLILAFALFAPTALVILTGPSPAAVFHYVAGNRTLVGTPLSHRELTFSVIADAVAWLICLGACILIGQLASRLRDRVPFKLTIYILGVFLVGFSAQRLLSYAPWSPLAHLGAQLQMMRATASVLVAIGAAVLFPYAKTMLQTVITANREHEKFVVAAESSLDAFYIFESVLDATGTIRNFRFAYINANGERRLARPRAELLGRNYDRCSSLHPFH